MGVNVRRSEETNPASVVGGLVEAATGPSGPASVLRIRQRDVQPRGPEHAGPPACLAECGIDLSGLKRPASAG